MESLHDARDVIAQMDTSPLQSPSNALSLAFSPLVSPRPEDPLIQNPMPCPSHDPVPVFQRPVDSNALHLPLADASPASAAILSMDALNTPSSSRAPAPDFISDFPSQNVSFTSLSRMDTHLTVHSPQSTSSGSSGASSAVHGPSSTYTLATPSIMACGQPVTHSVHPGPLSTVTALDSSASSASLPNSASELAFTPLNTGSLKPTQDSGFIFPPPDLPDSRFSGRDSSPETPGDSHLLVVGDMLKTIAHTAQSASTACSRGQGLEANVRIDELKKTITLVSELIAATKIADTPAVSRNPSPRRFSALGSKSSISNQNAVPVTQEQLVSAMYFSAAADIGTMDVQSNGDISDMSRKRCASSMAGDRVIKAPKREPQEDTPLHIIPPPVSNQPLFSSVVVPSLTDPRCVPPYVSANVLADPASRPTSSAGHPNLAGFGLIQHQPIATTMGFSIPGSPAAPPSSTEFISTSPLSTNMHFPPPPTVRTSWSDGGATLHHSHQHSHSASSLNAAINFHTIPSTSSSLGPRPFSTTGTFPSSSSQSRPLTNSGRGITPPIGRVSRSGSFTTGNVNPFALGMPDVTPSNALDFLHSAQPPLAQSIGSHSPTSSHEGEQDESDGASHSHSPPESSGVRTLSHHSSSSRAVTGHDVRPSSLVTRQSMETLSLSTSMPGHNNEVPQEYRAEVDRIFFEFLNSTCSNLEATDAKGEPIHQTLMAKKMQRLDESPDFRPFKFRIQAFTNAFLEELAKQGYPEEKIPMKKIRNYLWNQPYISRFNEDGKKTKSKGNHIWNIDAKKNPDGGWTFRPFHRKVAGSPPGVAYVGLRWSWAPRIWDPQASRSNLVVTYSSPSLPSWLYWEDDVLSGTPPMDAESCDITVVARYVQEGQEELLTQTFHLNIVPVSNLDTSFSASRRSSINGEIHKPRRVASDSTVPQTPRTLQSQTSATLAPPVTTRDAQVIQVLTSAAQRVAQEAQCQIISSATQGEPGPELQALAKQQHVLTITAQAFDQEVTGQRSEISPQTTNMLAVAAQQVVFQAARQVVADRSAAVASQISAGLTPPPVAATQVTVNEVSVATQSAVAQAVEITGPLSNEVDVLMTASSLLQQQFRAPVSPVSAMLDSAQRPISMDSLRTHSTGTLPIVPYPAAMTTPSNVPAIHFPSAISSGSLSDFGRLP